MPSLALLSAQPFQVEAACAQGNYELIEPTWKSPHTVQFGGSCWTSGGEKST